MRHVDIPHVASHTRCGGDASIFDDELDFDSLEVHTYYSGFPSSLFSGHLATSQTVPPSAGTNDSSEASNCLFDSSAGSDDPSDPMGMLNYLQSPKFEDNGASSSRVQLEQHHSWYAPAGTTSDQGMATLSS
jgi:hypothetical protein